MCRFLLATLALGTALIGWDHTPATGPPRQPAPADEKSVLDWIKELRAADSGMRRQAAEALARLGPKAAAAVPALIEALADKDVMVRRDAGRALSRIGEPAVPALIEALADKDVMVRHDARHVLSKMGKVAFPRLM